MFSKSAVLLISLYLSSCTQAAVIPFGGDLLGNLLRGGKAKPAPADPKPADNGPVCPAVWTTIGQQLKAKFVSGSQCTDLARAAVRFAFHDAGTFSLKLPFYAPAAGAADGSLLLNPDEISRAENAGLQPYHAFLTNFYSGFQSQVSAADLIYFAANLAVVVCPGGPTVTTLVGRKDTNVASPTGLMPPGFGPGSDHNSLLQLFIDKGFDAQDLAALVGAHTSARAFAQKNNGIPIGGAQDSTPGVWDVKFYGETYNPPANVFRFQSDINLSNTSTIVGKKFKEFVNNQEDWNEVFSDAMFHLTVLGIPAADVGNFIDCTNVLPPAILLGNAKEGNGGNGGKPLKTMLAYLKCLAHPNGKDCSSNNV